MNGLTATIVGLSVLSALFTAAICAFSRRFGNVAGLLDQPDGVRKMHQGNIPLTGGLAILLPTFFVSLLYIAFFRYLSYPLLAIAASALVLVLGVQDDRKGLSATIRMAVLIVVLIGLCLYEPLFILHTLRLNILGFPVVISFGDLALPATIFMVVGFVNASNMADGINGQLLGSILVWSMLLLLHIGFADSLPYLALFCSTAVALVFNLKGLLFSGSAGAYAAPLFVGLSTIAVYRLQNGGLAAELPLLWFYLPVMDCLRLFVWRMAKGRSPFSPDRNHFHHILIGAMPTSRALGVYLLMLAAPAICAEFDHQLGLVAAIVCIVCYAILVLRNHISEGEIAGFETEWRPTLSPPLRERRVGERRR